MEPPLSVLTTTTTDGATSMGTRRLRPLRSLGRRLMMIDGIAGMLVADMTPDTCRSVDRSPLTPSSVAGDEACRACEGGL